MAIPYSRTIIGSIPWYGVLIVTGMLLAIFLAEKEEKRRGLPADTIIDAVLVVIPVGIIGARLYYVAMSWSYFRTDPLAILRIWEGGLAIYGGVIFGLLALWIFSRVKKRSFLAMADCIAPGLILAQAIGRWGNYFNMEAYGPAILNPLFQFFPMGVLIPSGGGYVWHMATFFYESMWNLAGFALLWWLRKRIHAPGGLLAAYGVWYASGRFIIEGLRQDSLTIGPVRVSQLLSFVICILAAVWLIWHSCRDKKDLPLLLGLTALAAGRWLWVQQPLVYGIVSLAAYGVCGLVLLKRKKLVLLLPLLALLLLDAAALLGAQAPGSWQSFLGRVSSLCCAITTPAMIFFAALSCPAKEA